MSIIQIATRGTNPTKINLPFHINIQRKITEAQYFLWDKKQTKTIMTNKNNSAFLLLKLNNRKQQSVKNKQKI